jgi:L-threonylcarbamoyladenylate synthase
MSSEDILNAAARCVRQDGVLLYPTETVYGLGGNPTRPSVVARIREIKGRSAAKPMLLLTDDWERVLPWITGITSVHQALMDRSPPLPVTILFETGAAELEPVRAGASRIGIRCTGNVFCRRLIRAAGMPIISTSANISGRGAPRTFEAVDPQIVAAVDMYVDCGGRSIGRPSTVVAVEDGHLQIVRKGAVSADELRELL